MTNITSSNPVVSSILSGAAPRPARLAAATGLLPLPQLDLLEVLVALLNVDDKEIATAAQTTLREQEKSDLLAAAKDDNTAPAVLSYLATSYGTVQEIGEATILNTSTPDEAIISLAGHSRNERVLESIAMNQQRLIRSPQIIDAILQNPSRSAEAERRARETRQEFFEKERGARQIAEELRARGNNAAAEFFESADLTSASGTFSLDDAWLIAQHIEVSDADIDDSWLPAERYVELAAETLEDHTAALNKILESERLEDGEIDAARVSLIKRIIFMNARARMKLALKGDREARSILIRDTNKVVSSAVMINPRITDQEVENISAMRTVSDDVLRVIAMNRNWARSYKIIHNLVRNPRTPIPTVIGILPRIRSKDLQQLSQNRNVSETARRQAKRLAQMRSGE